MKQIRKDIGILILLIGINGFGINAQMFDISRKPGDGLTEQEYIYAFTEATRYYLFGNYNQAVALYNECLKIKPENGAVHFQLAKIFLNSGNTALAREHAKKAYIFDKGNKWYSQQLADIYQIEEKFDSASVVYENLLRIEPQNWNTMMGLASLYERTQKYEEALKILEEIDSKAGISREVALSRYSILEKTGNSTKALEQLKIARDLSEEDYGTLSVMIAEFFRRHNMPDSAEHYYKVVSAGSLTDPVFALSYADYLMEKGEQDSAKALLLNVISGERIDEMTKAGFFFKVLRDEKEFEKVKPIIDTISAVYYRQSTQDMRRMSVYADVQLRLRKYPSAGVALKKIVDQDPSNYPAIEQLIYTLNILGKSDSVILYSDRAIQRFKDNPVLYLFNGSAKFQKKEYERALLVLQKGLSFASEEPVRIEFYSLIAECFQNLGNFEESEKAFNMALKLDPDNLLIKNNFAYYLSLREKNLNVARKMSRETIKAEPENSTYLDTYAWILFKMGRKKAARKIILTAMENGGDTNEEILSHAADIHVSLKEYSEALRFLKAILNKSDAEKESRIKARIAEIENKIQ